jgi:cell shape-determining protein MreD
MALLLYIFCGLVFLLVLAFLAFTGYLHYVHWKYSHIPQPSRPRWVAITLIPSDLIIPQPITILYSFYLGHLPDMSKTASKEQSLITVLQKW